MQNTYVYARRIMSRGSRVLGCLVLRCWVLWVMDGRCLVLSDGRGLWDTNNIRRN